MVLLSAHNIKETTLHLIDSPVIHQEHRPYLGASQLGHTCDRYLWYSFRWCYESEISSRLQRLFNRGHREEPEIIKELEKIGIKCYGDQTEFVAGHGHIRGHCDGMADNVPEAPKTTHLLEFKTMNDKSFKDLKKKGLKMSKPVYWAQVQLYMHGLGLTRCLHINVNKNDDDLYIERIRYDEEDALSLLRKGMDILYSEFPPIKKLSPTWYECKWCNAKGICHGNQHIHETCRTCEHGDLVVDGNWECSYNGPEHATTLTVERQRIGCTEYKQIEL